MLLKAEEEGLDESAIPALMGRHTVTRESVMQACLRNRCESTYAFRYGIRHLEDLDVEGFAVELVEALLDQPYRGAMLK